MIVLTIDPSNGGPKWKLPEGKSQHNKISSTTNFVTCVHVRLHVGAAANPWLPRGSSYIINAGICRRWVLTQI